jgi:hypothetical protein
MGEQICESIFYLQPQQQHSQEILDRIHTNSKGMARFWRNDKKVNRFNKENFSSQRQESLLQKSIHTETRSEYHVSSFFCHL